MTTSNPFAFAIIVHGADSKRGKWLSGGGLSSNRIHAECFPSEDAAQRCADSCATSNPDFKFTVRKFSK